MPCHTSSSSNNTTVVTTTMPPTTLAPAFSQQQPLQLQHSCRHVAALEAAGTGGQIEGVLLSSSSSSSSSSQLLTSSSTAAPANETSSAASMLLSSLLQQQQSNTGIDNNKHPFDAATACSTTPFTTNTTATTDTVAANCLSSIYTQQTGSPSEFRTNNSMASSSATIHSMMLQQQQQQQQQKKRKISPSPLSSLLSNTVAVTSSTSTIGSTAVAAVTGTDTFGSLSIAPAGLVSTPSAFGSDNSKSTNASNSILSCTLRSSATEQIVSFYIESGIHMYIESSHSPQGSRIGNDGMRIAQQFFFEALDCLFVYSKKQNQQQQLLATVPTTQFSVASQNQTGSSPSKRMKLVHEKTIPATSSSCGASRRSSSASQTTPENHNTMKTTSATTTSNQDRNDFTTTSTQSSTPPVSFQSVHQYDEGLTAFPTMMNISRDVNATTTSSSCNHFISIALFYNIAQTYVVTKNYVEACKWYKLAIVDISTVLEQHQQQLLLPSYNHYYNNNSATILYTTNAAFLVYYNLGCISYQLGRANDAVMTFRESLTLISNTIFMQQQQSSSLSQQRQQLQTLRQYEAAAANALGVLLFHHGNAALISTPTAGCDGTNPNANNSTTAVPTGASNSTAVAHFDQSLRIYRILAATIHTSSSSNADGKTYHTRNLAVGLNNIGRAQYTDGNLIEAKIAYMEALSIRSRLLGVDSIDTMATLCSLGQTHHRLGELGLAKTCYENFLRRAVVVSTGSPEETVVSDTRYSQRDVFIITKNLAEIYHNHGDHAAAVTQYQHALQISRQSFGNVHPEVAATLNRLGNLYYEARDYSKALKCYTEGYCIEQTSLPACHPRTVTTLMNLAQIYCSLGNFSVALTKYKEVYTMKVSMHGSCSLEVAKSMSAMGEMQYKLKNYDAAFELFQDTLLMQRLCLSQKKQKEKNNESTNTSSSYADDGLEVAATLNSLGITAFAKRDRTIAKDCFERSLEIRQRELGMNHKDCATLWYNLATTSEEDGDEDQAEAMYKETLRIERRLLQEKKQPAVVVATTNTIASASNNFSVGSASATENISRSSSTNGVTTGDVHSNINDVVDTLQRLGRLFQRRGNLDEALTYFEQALCHLSERQHEDSSSDAATAAHCLTGQAKLLNMIGNLNLQMGNVKEMMEAYTAATRLYKTAGMNPEDALVIAGYYLYGLSQIHPEAAPIA